MIKDLVSNNRILKIILLTIITLITFILITQFMQLLFNIGVYCGNFLRHLYEIVVC